MKKEMMIALGVLFLIPFVSAQIIWDDASTKVILKGLACPGPYTAWIDAETYPPINYSTIAIGENKIYDCRDPSGGDPCCPETLADCVEVAFDVEYVPGYEIADGKYYSCYASNAYYCSDFSNQEECEGANQFVVTRSVEENPNYGEGYCSLDPIIYPNNFPQPTIKDYCIDTTECQCYWNSTDCLGRGYLNKSCYSDSGNNSIIDEDCYWEISDDGGCDEGNEFMHVIWTAVPPSNPADCPDQEQDIYCGNIIKLEFFTFINVIVVIMIIILIYYLMHSSKKKTGKGKKKK
jgi:hypothetical protein